MYQNQIQSMRDKKLGVYQDNLFCTHTIHTIKNRGRPVKISKEQFQKHQCKARKCMHLFIDRSLPEHEEKTVL